MFGRREADFVRFSSLFHLVSLFTQRKFEVGKIQMRMAVFLGKSTFIIKDCMKRIWVERAVKLALQFQKTESFIKTFSGRSH